MLLLPAHLVLLRDAADLSLELAVGVRILEVEQKGLFQIFGSRVVQRGNNAAGKSQTSRPIILVQARPTVDVRVVVVCRC